VRAAGKLWRESRIHTSVDMRLRLCRGGIPTKFPISIAVPPRTRFVCPAITRHGFPRSAILPFTYCISFTYQSKRNDTNVLRANVSRRLELQINFLLPRTKVRQKFRICLEKYNEDLHLKRQSASFPMTLDHPISLVNRSSVLEIDSKELICPIFQRPSRHECEFQVKIFPFRFPRQAFVRVLSLIERIR